MDKVSSSNLDGIIFLNFSMFKNDECILSGNIIVKDQTLKNAEQLSPKQAELT
jgi:hypothetical protein